MKKFEKILDGLKNRSPIPLLLDNGYTPSKMKEEIIQTFKPYFRNYSNLERFAIDSMVADWINFLRLSIKYPGIENDIKKVVDTYNDAKKENYQDTITVLAKLIPVHLESGNKYWSFLNLEIDKKDLEIYEFAKTSMEDISNTIEGISKSVYVENVLINKIKRKKSFEIEKTLTNKLGNLIQDLIDNSNYSSLFIVPKENLKISDWRNIAAHHKYYVSDDLINCESGEGDKKVTFYLNRSELFERLNYCMRTTEVLNMSHKIFGFDNLPEISKKIEKVKGNPRPEIKFLMFSSALMSQGFEIQNINYDKSKATLELFDLTKESPRNRGIHSSQLLNQLWMLTDSEFLEIKYFKNNGELYLTSRIKGEIFKQMEVDKNKGTDFFAKNVDFEL
ncbi:hypothetical protein L1I30_00140 [Gillisia sp. M10.2A]|uniref:Uncharacterized protein n=1 Tax=Gillisia lutea TaxID=2909668 RepID=A0ABS9EAZ5_9FLAO|nr:hypothetical protein [Gillisia lutea]MCF4100062.1 hypothetical protein [Gillisia lutea]